MVLTHSAFISFLVKPEKDLHITAKLLPAVLITEMIQEADKKRFLACRPTYFLLISY